MRISKEQRANATRNAAQAVREYKTRLSSEPVAIDWDSAIQRFYALLAQVYGDDETETGLSRAQINSGRSTGTR